MSEDKIVTEEYVDFKLYNGTWERVYKKDDPGKYFTMGGNFEGDDGEDIREDYKNTETYGNGWY